MGRLESEHNWGACEIPNQSVINKSLTLPLSNAFLEPTFKETAHIHKLKKKITLIIKKKKAAARNE